MAALHTELSGVKADLGIQMEQLQACVEQKEDQLAAVAEKRAELARRLVRKCEADKGKAAWARIKAVGSTQPEPTSTQTDNETTVSDEGLSQGPGEEEEEQEERYDPAAPRRRRQAPRDNRPGQDASPPPTVESRAEKAKRLMAKYGRKGEAEVEALSVPQPVALPPEQPPQF